MLRSLINMPPASTAGGTVSNLEWSQVPNLTVVEETGTARTLSDSDAGKVILCTNVSGCTITFPDTLSTEKYGVVVQGIGAGVVDWDVAGSMVITMAPGSVGLSNTGGEYGAIYWKVLETNSAQIETGDLYNLESHASTHTSGGSDQITELVAQSQATWEAGVGTQESVVSPAKVAAAIAAQSAGGSPGGSSGQVQFNDSSSFGGAPLWREDANTLRQRNGANAQTFSVANTWTDASNYEVANYTANGVALVSAGTGSANRDYTITPAGTGSLVCTGPVKANGYIHPASSQAGYYLFVNPSGGGYIDIYAGSGFRFGWASVGSNCFGITQNTIQFGRNALDCQMRIELKAHDAATTSLTVRGQHAFPTATTNIVGGSTYVAGGDGASSSAGAANGGNAHLDGGRAYGTGVDGDVIVGATRGDLRLKSSTVAALPSASVAGRRRFVTDANATTFHSIVAGGGSNYVPVFSDGTNWRIG